MVSGKKLLRFHVKDINSSAAIKTQSRNQQTALNRFKQEDVDRMTKGLVKINHISKEMDLGNPFGAEGKVVDRGWGKVWVNADGLQPQPYMDEHTLVTAVAETNVTEAELREEYYYRKHNSSDSHTENEPTCECWGVCLFCEKAPRSRIFDPCGCLTACYSCADRCLKYNTCLTCGSKVTQITRFFTP